MIALVLVLALVVVAGAAGVAVARRRKDGPTVHIDPFTIGEPWRRHVSSAQSTEHRYAEVVGRVPAGPLRERLTAIGQQVRRGVQECWQIARRGDEVDDALQRIDQTSIRSQLARATDDATKSALQSQLDAAARIRASRDVADQRLRTLNIRLDELVAQAAEVSLGADTSAELGTGVDDVITELEALRLAIDDVNAASGATSVGSSGTEPDQTGAAPGSAGGVSGTEPGQTGGGAGTTTPPT